ncbi:MAG: hypothetical protein ABID09_01915 [Candidatus Omnitrophota bacterium]
MKAIVIVLLCLALAGCATTQPRLGYKSADIKEMYLKDLSDEKVIEMFNDVYDKKVTIRVDEAAKDITITALMTALQTTRSEEIKRSGILEREYKKIDLRKWTDEDLLSAYRALERETKEKETESPEKAGKSKYWGQSSGSKDKKETEKKTLQLETGSESLNIIRLTALYSIGGEISRRDSVSGIWATVGHAVGTTVGIATKVAMLLAAFMI